MKGYDNGSWNKVYLTIDPKQADEWIEKLHICRNCTNWTQNTLFDGTCSGYCDGDWTCPPFDVDFDNVCECFFAKEKIIEYWLCKLGQIYLDYSGSSDEIREFLALKT